jgi:hypothetical protein
MGITVDTRDRLCVIERTMSYNGTSLKASANVPERLQANQCPIFINIPGRAVRRPIADRWCMVTRTWNCKLYALAVGDALLTAAENMLYDYIDLFYDTFVAVPRLEYNNDILDYLRGTELTGDSGILVESYPQNDPQSPYFYTVTFNLDVSHRILLGD